MDMNMTTDPNVANLLLSDPRCNSEACIAFLDAENLSQKITPWLGQFAYGRWTTWYYLVLLGIFTIAYHTRKWADRKINRHAHKSSTLTQKVMAGCRYLAYRRIPGRSFQMLELPSMGVLALLLLTVVFLAGLVFTARPYYRQHNGYGSPPIAIRSGLMAYACTPILIALAGKANIITLLTGVSHEKLNVIHRWVGWIILVLSLVHAIPFFYAPLHDVGYTTLDFEFDGYGLGGGTMYSGVPALAILAALVFFSIPWIRHRLYEAFYFSHVAMALVYLGLLFWHAGNLGDSWAYLWATLAVLLAQWLARLFYYTRPFNLRSTWLSGAMTTLKSLPGGMTSIEVLAPQDFDYRPGQHCFLGFPALSLLDSHPFTIASAPPSITAGKEMTHELLFMARTYSGFTKKLSESSGNIPEKPIFAWIDGPYGGVSRQLELQYDTLVLVAGGSGITVCLPWIKCLVQAKESRVTRLALWWAVKDRSHLGWAEEALKEVHMLQQHTKEKVKVDRHFFITRSIDSGNEKISIPSDVGEKGKASNEILSASSSSSHIDSDPAPHYVYRRPDMREIVSEEAQRGGKVFVIGCGPEEMRIDLSNAVANAQANVFAGSVQDIALHLEAFGM